MAEHSELQTGLQSKLQTLSEAGLPSVPVEHLTAMLNTSASDVLETLAQLGVRVEAEVIPLSGLSFRQDVRGDAYSQVGNHNQQFNVSGHLLQLGPNGAQGAQHIAELFPQPGEEARRILRQNMHTFLSWVQSMPPLANLERDAAIAWYAQVEEACRPLAMALYEAVAKVPEDIVSSEITGFMCVAIKTLDIRLGYDHDTSLMWRSYPLVLIATAAATAAIQYARYQALHALVDPVLPQYGSTNGKSLRWIYMLHYVDGLPKDYAFPPAQRLTGGAQVDHHIEQLLSGPDGWLSRELPAYGGETVVRNAVTGLATLSLDNDLAYFGNGHQHLLRHGHFMYYPKAAKGMADQFISDVVRSGVPLFRNEPRDVDHLFSTLPQHLTLRELDVWVGGNGVLSSSRQAQKVSPPHRTA